MSFTPDYRNILAAAQNKKPNRIPLYEHGISDEIMERMTGESFRGAAATDLDKYFSHYCAFFPAFGYDTVTYEGCVTEILPHGGALAHPQPGWVEDRQRFEEYPWGDVLGLYIKRFAPCFSALAKNMPKGMAAIGGVGNGVFEIVQDLVGFENLCILSFEDPELYRDIFVRVGDLLVSIWKWFLKEYGSVYCVARFGDDLGYKQNTMLPYDDIKRNIVPQYARIVSLVHESKKPFLLHSCGCIFAVMDDIISTAKIDAKHSNEDQIAPMSEWVGRFGARIGNFGGIDTDHLVRMDNAALKTHVEGIYDLAKNKDGGLAIGSGNSIPAYVNPEKYKIMIDTVRTLRGDRF